LAVGIGALGFHAKQVGPAVVASVAIPLQNAAQQVSLSAPGKALSNAGATVAAAIAEKPVSTAREVELDDGQTFAELLTDQGISEGDAAAAMNALAKVYDMRKLKAGQDITLSFLSTGRQETLTGATFQPEDTSEITVRRAADSSFKAEVTNIPVSHHRFAASGQIRSSLYEAGDAAGVPHAVMATLIRTYSHDIDFQRDIHPGDSFEVLYDQSTTAKGKSVGEGTIIYAAMHVGGKDKPIYRVTFSDNTVDYFDASGRSIRRALLRTPVAAARITSGYGMRIHPLLGYSKMHKGVDFGAPMGAPIFAAGSGTIEDIGFKNGYGRYILIRHNGTLATAYAHMSRFNAKLYRGARVDQGEVIGYVGMSGRATGPHLHFEVHVNGQQVNPMSVNLPTGRVLDGKLLTAFKQGQSHIKQEFDTLAASKNKQTSAPSGNVVLASTKP
jgi:murein DD-endopeptidase MepM/ murein hydrolase activator NlpD